MTLKLKSGAYDLPAGAFALAEKLIPIALKFFKDGGDPAHDFLHVDRVLRLAITIAKTEKEVNYEELVSMVILHDIGRKQEVLRPEIRHEIWGADKASKILKKETNFSDKQIEKICNGIREHRGSMSVPCTSLESKILKDADKIDSLGDVGFARTFTYAGVLLQPYYSFNVFEGEEEEDVYTVEQEYETKLSLVHTKMETRKGQELALKRAERLRERFENFKAEVQGVI